MAHGRSQFSQVESNLALFGCKLRLLGHSIHAGWHIYTRSCVQNKWVSDRWNEYCNPKYFNRRHSHSKRYIRATEKIRFLQIFFIYESCLQRSPLCFVVHRKRLIFELFLIAGDRTCFYVSKSSLLCLIPVTIIFIAFWLVSPITDSEEQVIAFIGLNDDNRKERCDFERYRHHVKNHVCFACWFL